MTTIARTEAATIVRTETSSAVKFSVIHPDTRYTLLDHRGYTIGALGDGRVLLAAGSGVTDKGAVIPASLMHHVPNPWSKGLIWSVELPHGENPVCLAFADSVVLVATDALLLRILSEAGSHIATIGLPGLPIALAGRGPLALVVCEQAGAVSAILFSLADSAVLLSLPVPLLPDVSVHWAGITPDGSPAIYDTQGRLWMPSTAISGMWELILDLAAPYRTEPAAGAAPLFFSPLAVTSSELLAVPVSQPSWEPGNYSFPSVLRPQTSTTLQPQVIPFSADMGVLPGPFSAQEAGAAAARRTADVAALFRREDKVVKGFDLAADKLYLGLINSSLNGSFPARAVAFARQLVLRRTCRAAVAMGSGGSRNPQMQRRLEQNAEAAADTQTRRRFLRPGVVSAAPCAFEPFSPGSGYVRSSAVFPAAPTHLSTGVDAGAPEAMADPARDAPLAPQTRAFSGTKRTAGINLFQSPSAKRSQS
jgi:hypothetical protein